MSKTSGFMKTFNLIRLQQHDEGVDPAELEAGGCPQKLKARDMNTLALDKVLGSGYLLA